MLVACSTLRLSGHTSKCGFTTLRLLFTFSVIWSVFFNCGLCRQLVLLFNLFFLFLYFFIFFTSRFYKVPLVTANSLLYLNLFLELSIAILSNELTVSYKGITFINWLNKFKSHIKIAVSPALEISR